MRRHLIALIAAVLIASFGAANPAATAAAQICVGGVSLDYTECSSDFVISVEGLLGNVGSLGTWPPPGWVPYTRIGLDDTGNPCETTAYHAPGLYPEDVAGYEGGTMTPAGTFAPCPGQRGQEAEDPAIVAARYWEQVPLPRPGPHIAPGWAITGKLAYLETNGETRHVYTNSTPVGPLEIVATGRYYVDWGDGETSGPYSFEGRPWPVGEITHEYIWAGTYDIVVTERWTATWSLGGRSGLLRELQTTGRIEDFRAEQIQAVVSVR